MGQDVPYVPMPVLVRSIRHQIADRGTNGYDAVYERRDADSDAQSFSYYQAYIVGG